MKGERQHEADCGFEVSDASVLVKDPVVSVVMPAFNHAPYIVAAIESVLMQKTDFPFELLIGEDASKDNTREIALRYQRAHPHLIRVIGSLANVGMHENLRRLGEACRADYIAYCEADDFWLDSAKLQTQVDFLRDRPDYGAVHGNYLNLIYLAGAWRTRLAFRKPKQLQCRSGRIYPAMLQTNRMQTCTVMCRRRFVAGHRQTRLNLDRYCVVDWPLFLNIAREFKIGFIDRPLAAYRQTPGSVTNSGYSAAVERGLDAIRMIEDFSGFHGDAPEIRMSALATQYRALLWTTFHAGDRSRFDAAWSWLAVNRPVPLVSITRVLWTLMRWPSARMVALKLHTVVRPIKRYLQFRRSTPG